MRIAAKLNIPAIIVAALLMYAAGFVIYGLVFSEYWRGLTGYDAAAYAGLEWRMALSPVMPLLIAIGTAVAVTWRGARGLGQGLWIGFLLWLFFSLAARLYGFTYLPEPQALLALDAAHLLIIHLIAGAVIAVWRS